MKSRFALGVLAGACIALTTRLPAQAPADTLTVAQAVRIALDSNPMLEAARSRARAARHRVGPAGALPDPQLQLGLMNRMVSDFGSTMEPMTMDQVQLMQMIPWPGRLAATRRAARHEARAVDADADERALMLAADVRMAYAEVASTARVLDVMRGTRELLRQLQDVSTAMYAVGSAEQQDVLRAQVEVARMDEEIARMEQMWLAAAVRLNTLLGRSAAAPVGATSLPDIPATDVPPRETLIQWALDGRPGLRAAAERVGAADASLAAARRELWPDVQLAVAWQRRPAFPDMMSVMVGVNLPLFAGARQLPMRREMAAMRDMAVADVASLRLETTARVVELRARIARNQHLARLYRASVLPQARAAVQAARAGYRAGRVSFMQIVDNQMTVNRYETEVYRLAADYQEAIGELEALVGRDLEGQP